MAKRESIEAFDQLLKDIMNCQKTFGGKTVVFGGDFRQTLPVIENASINTQIDSSIVNSPLWPAIHKIRLAQNMRAILDPAFSQFLLRIGEGLEPVDENGQVLLPNNLVLPFDNRDHSINRLVESVFSNLQLYSVDPYKMINRCILSPKNSSVDELNEMMIKRFPGKLHVYTSTDKAVDERYQGDYEDFFQLAQSKGPSSTQTSVKRKLSAYLDQKPFTN